MIHLVLENSKFLWKGSYNIIKHEHKEPLKNEKVHKSLIQNFGTKNCDRKYLRTKSC
jgi:hypothetical protein